MRILVGYNTDRDGFFGYQPGHRLDLQELVLEGPGEVTVELARELCEAIFMVTNTWGSEIPVSGFHVEAITNAYAASREQGWRPSHHTSLSVGDVIQLGQVTLECKSVGFEPIETPDLS